VPTGFTDLDNMLSGLQRSDLVILASRPSMGKSSLAMDFARHVAVRENLPVGLFSLEMSMDQVVDRLIASQSGVDLWKIRTGKLSSRGDDNDFARIRDALGVLAEAPIYIDDAATANVLQMRAMARRLQADKGLGLLVVDYLQLVEPRTAQESMVQQISEISRSLKGLARELNVPVLAISQLSRAVEQRTPQIPRLSDLRDSGGLEQDADVVLFIYREDRYREESDRKNLADIIIAKHRNGPVGKIELYFNEQIASFSNLAREERDFNA
jgi:replicative DNA helicase